MIHLSSLLCCLILLALFIGTHAYARYKATNIISEMVDIYYENEDLTTVVPNEDNDTPLNVSMTMFIYSINGFDAVSGQMEIAISLSLSWHDYNLYSNIALSDINNASYVPVPYSRIWTPNLVLLNDVQSVERIGSSSYYVTYYPDNGIVTWKPRIILKGSCSPNMTYFPFDRQECSFVFSAWEHDTSQVKLVIPDSSWDTSMYEGNGVWKITETKSETYVGSSGQFDSYYAKFSITIERQPLFILVNLVLPILLLAAINGFCFLVPISNGRVTYCITCFLTFVFLLQTVQQFLPRTSYPMSILAIYVVLMMLFSAVVNIITVFTMRLHLAPSKDKVPKWLQVFLKTIKCRICRECKKKTEQNEGDEIQINGRVTFAGQNKVGIVNDHVYEKKKKAVKEVKWPEVARSLDIFFFVLFLGVQAVFSVFFLVPLGTRA
ncbi:hypothetical protein CHS0354_017871 [Potamilus streckersoni]|uniref:Uncharacterized protein n=1 Tax=Potamilus streckersoni TaxID=2493646 RepID=A0AAE0WE94_9BIVA|nr:hypothetical protein CHS0354_017871 [Potamilus streckersoni]